MKKTKKASQSSHLLKQLSKQMLAQVKAENAPASRIVSPAQSAQTQAMTRLGEIWATLGSDQQGWQTLANAINARDGRTGKAALTAARTFMLCNLPLLATGMPVQTVAGPLIAPVGLPPVLFTASVTTDPTPVLTMTLHSALYDGNCQVWGGCKTALPGKKTRSTSACLLLGKLDGIVPIGVGVDGLWTAKLPAPSAGAQVTLKLVPITDSGFRGTPLLLTTTVTDASAQDTGDTDGEKLDGENTRLHVA